jgi:hypothetical protein
MGPLRPTVQGDGDVSKYLKRKQHFGQNVSREDVLRKPRHSGECSKDKLVLALN